MKYDVENRRIWFKGEILNVNDAKINILAPTSQFGLNVFEGIPGYWNSDNGQLYIFRLEDHIKRLEKSMKLILLRQTNTMKIFLFVPLLLLTVLDHGDQVSLQTCSWRLFLEEKRAQSIIKKDSIVALRHGEELMIQC